jgi:tetratricopeptide (TPR) repeat protein
LTRSAALRTYGEAAELFRELNKPLDEAWVLRHIGIIHEYAERLELAEEYYDRALALYREHGIDDLDHANALRYPAVVKDRLGKRAESETLWREAVSRYEQVGVAAGVAEGSLHLTEFAIDRGGTASAREWFEKAEQAAANSTDKGTRDFLERVRKRLKGSA